MASGCREVAGTMVLGGATSKIRQQVLISLCSQSRHSRPVVEGEDVSVSEKQVGSGEGPLQSPLWQSLSPPPRKQALKSKSPGPPIPPARESQQGGGASLSTRGQKALHVEEAASPSNPRDPRICRQVQSLLAKQRVCSRCYILSAGL